MENKKKITEELLTSLGFEIVEWYDNGDAGFGGTREKDQLFLQYHKGHVDYLQIDRMDYDKLMYKMCKQPYFGPVEDKDDILRILAIIDKLKFLTVREVIEARRDENK